MNVLRNRIHNVLGELAQDSTAPENVAERDLASAALAFERDMQPVCKAVVEALQAGDLQAFEGLRGMLPHLLAEVNERPELADVLTHQLGRELLEGMRKTL